MSLYLLFFSISFSAMFLSDGTVISINFQVELTTMSGLFAVVVLSVLTGTSNKIGGGSGIIGSLLFIIPFIFF